MRNMRLLLLISISSVLVLVSCSKEANSEPSFTFKKAPEQGVAASVSGTKISDQEMRNGIENEIFDLEQKLYELKFNQLKSLVIKKLVEKEAKGMDPDKYIEEKIIGTIEPTQKDIDKFVRDRNIPKEHMNDQLKARIKKFLVNELQAKTVDQWLAKKSKKENIEIYLQHPERPYFEVKVGDAPITGGKDAKVTIVEFSDFECPFCAKGAKVLQDIKKKYGKKVKVAFKHFPLPFHKKAKGASYASMCAREQGDDKFWKMHDIMFENQDKLDNAGLEDLAKKAALDVTMFKTCVSANKYVNFIEGNINEGKEAGVRSTPTFFVNGRIISGAQPLKVFIEEIDKHL